MYFSYDCPLSFLRFILCCKRIRLFKTSILVLLVLKIMPPFLWMEFNCLNTTEPLRGDSLILTTKCPGVPVTHLINLGGMKSWVDIAAIQWSETWDPWIGNSVFKHLHTIQLSTQLLKIIIWKTVILLEILMKYCGRRQLTCAGIEGERGYEMFVFQENFCTRWMIPCKNQKFKLLETDKL